MNSRAVGLIIVTIGSVAWPQWSEAVPVEWAVANGGNGHHYEILDLTGPDRSWETVRVAAADRLSR